jgi:hypothetical protein
VFSVIEAGSRTPRLGQKFVYFYLLLQPVVFRQSVLECALLGSQVGSRGDHAMSNFGRDAIRR